MAELFESYQTDFAQLTASISAKLQKDATLSGEARKSALRRAEMEAEEADEILGQMDIEVAGFPQSLKSKYSAKLRGFRTELDRLRKDIRTQLASSSGRPYGGSGAGGYSIDGDADLESGVSNDPQAQRQRLLQGTATLEDGSRRLEESHRLALETEDLGADILRDLRGQREQIEHSRDTLREADSNIDRSSRTLQQMIRRAKQQKLTMIGIVVVLVLLILLILYSKLF